MSATANDADTRRGVREVNFDGLVGPTHNYAFLTPQSKILLSVLMLLGRLELFAILVLFVPSFWRSR